uniref:Retinoic acid receptor responder protein 2 n=1 Tax=Geotrypetes seraphini TaxID=260995 RepID=A0A6P8PGP7_GEOSA|nr:retinoic acid receptor responder protein 2-like isoform X2 [Geotrypetes seraphini]
MLKALFLAVCLTCITSYVPGTNAQIRLKDKTVALAVADFNTKSRHFAYKELDILSSTETDLNTGKFIKVTYTIKQTNCNKRNYQPARCRHKVNGRVLHCVACFGYKNSEDEPAVKFVDCGPTALPEERTSQQQQRCETVQSTISDRYRLGGLTILAKEPSSDHNMPIEIENVALAFQ